jgi:hypothetical protein
MDPLTIASLALWVLWAVGWFLIGYIAGRGLIPRVVDAVREWLR